MLAFTPKYAQLQDSCRQLVNTCLNTYLMLMMTAPTLSESAAKRVAMLKTRQGNPNLLLRLSVDGGGCSGFQYKFGFDETVRDDDITVERDGVTMVVDSVSLPFLEGAVVDYVETLGAAAFQVKNPQATASCGCGSSFAV
jgi:iron-sulfur cluster insertion protein